MFLVFVLISNFLQEFGLRKIYFSLLHSHIIKSGMLITTLEKYILGLLNEYIVIHELSFLFTFW